MLQMKTNEETKWRETRNDVKRIDFLKFTFVYFCAEQRDGRVV